jgi:hypothetical protein
LRTATIELDIQHTMEKLKNQMKAHNKEVWVIREYKVKCVN